MAAGDVSGAHVVIQQGRTVFKRTPKAKSKRSREFVNAVGHGFDTLVSSLMPNKTPSRRETYVKDALDKHIKKKQSKAGVRGELISNDDGNLSYCAWYTNKVVLCYSVDKADVNTAKIAIASDLFERVKDQTPRERRPIMALASEHMSKSKAQEALGEGETISRHEWTVARKHAKFPGPLKPVEEIVHTKSRFNIQDVQDFLCFFEVYLQSHAFGDNDIETANKSLVQIDALSHTADQNKIIRDYNAQFNSGASLPAAGKCNKRLEKSRSHCHLPKSHTGRCSFCSENTLSQSSLERVIKTITKGKLESRAGLDDEDVLKGGNSIERLIEIYDILSVALDLEEEDIKATKQNIQRMLAYHKTEFAAHLDKAGKRRCQCISCGLHSKKEPIPCQLRDDGLHESPCKECEDSFQIYSELLSLCRDAQLRLGTSPARKQKYVELEVEINLCRTNLIHWRSHMARKKVEAEFSRRQMCSLKKNQAIVISDFKMKLLPIYFRENQRKFFGKRGTACLGFMVLTNVEEKEGEVDVHFFFFFSNDTLQDTNFVLAGKAYVYNEFLPTQFPDGTKIEAFFESDGAGAFNSNLAKACQPYWLKWTNGRVEEIQIRHSVNGDGKTSLDGAFGKLGKNLHDAVNNRITDIEDAESYLLAYQSGAGIRGVPQEQYWNQIGNKYWNLSRTATTQYFFLAIG